MRKAHEEAPRQGLKSLSRSFRLKLVVDSSVVAHAAKVTVQPAGQPDWSFSLQVPYTVAQAGFAVAGQWSSTARETVGIRSMVLEAVRRLQATHCFITVICDNQATVNNFDSWRAPDLNQRAAIRDVAALALQRDIEFDFQWEPRTEDGVKAVDALSKQPDRHDWHTAPYVFQQLSRLWEQPTLDAFASAAQDGHLCSRYFTLIDSPGSSGIDGFKQPWRNADGSKPVVYAFLGLFADVGLVIRKI